MEKNWKMTWKLGVYRGITGLWLVGNEGAEKKMEITLLGLGFRVGIQEWERENGNYYIGFYRDYYKDPVLHSELTKGQ